VVSFNGRWRILKRLCILAVRSCGRLFLCFVRWAGQLRHPNCALQWIRRDRRWVPLQASMWGSTVASSLNRWINIVNMYAHMTFSLFVYINSIQRTELLIFFIRNSVSSFEEYGNHKQTATTKFLIPAVPNRNRIFISRSVANTVHVPA